MNFIKFERIFRELFIYVIEMNNSEEEKKQLVTLNMFWNEFFRFIIYNKMIA